MKERTETMLVGYARVSTQEQNLDLQRRELKKAGCKKIYEDAASGKLTDRQGLKLALEVLREGDTLVVWKLDRLGRGLKLCLEKTKKDNGWQKTCPARHNMVLDF